MYPTLICTFDAVVIIDTQIRICHFAESELFTKYGQIVGLF